MDLVAIVDRIAAVVGQERGLDRVVVQVVAVEVLGQAVRHVHTEAVGAMVGPEADGCKEVLAHVRVIPIPVGLFDREQVQVPLAVLHARPGGAAETGGPVGRRQFAVFATAFAEDVAVALGRTGTGLERGLEPFVQVGGVVGDDVHHNLDAVGVRGFGETVEVVHRAQTRVHVAVVVHVIAAVGQLAGVEGAEPDRVHAEFGQVVDLLGHAVQVTQAGAGGILERTRVDLVDHGLLPPVQLGPVGARLAGRPHGVGHVGHRRLSFPVSAVSPVM